MIKLLIKNISVIIDGVIELNSLPRELTATALLDQHCLSTNTTAVAYYWRRGGGGGVSAPPPPSDTRQRSI